LSFFILPPVFFTSSPGLHHKKVQQLKKEVEDVQGDKNIIIDKLLTCCKEVSPVSSFTSTKTIISMESGPPWA